MGEYELQDVTDFMQGDDTEGLASSEAVGEAVEDLQRIQTEASITEKSAEQLRTELEQSSENVQRKSVDTVDLLGQKTGIDDLSKKVSEAQKTGKVDDPKAKAVLDKAVSTFSEGTKKISENPTLKKKFQEWLKENEGKIIIAFLIFGGTFIGIEEFLQHVADKKLENCYKYNLNSDGAYSLVAIPNCNDPGLCNCAHISQCGQPPCSENFYYSWNNYDMNVIIGSIPSIAAQTWNNPDFMQGANLTKQILIFIVVVVFIIFSGILTYRLFLKNQEKKFY